METTEFKGSLLYDIMLPRLEVLFVLLGLLGGMMFWNHWVRTETLFIIGLGGLAEVYFLKAFKPQKVADEINFPQQYFNTENPFSLTTNQSFFLDTLAPKVMYISGAIVLVGVLFKLMFWNGGNTMLVSSVPLLVFFSLAWALNQRVNRRAIVGAVLGCLLLFTSEQNLVRQLHRDDSQLVNLMVNQLRHPHDRATNEALRAYQHEKRVRR